MVEPPAIVRQPDTHGRRLQYFAMLTQAEQHAAIRKLSAGGMGIQSIAAAAQITPEQVRAVLAATE